MFPVGKLVLGDKGYRGEPEIISTPNSHDPVKPREFISRARARHETFNGCVKKFRCLSERFHHHSDENHKIVFEAVCVICKYQLETDSSLFVDHK
jgi:hypothetical protein